MASNLRYVLQLAFMHRGYGISVEDLVGEGNIGLLEALKKFDLTRKLRFISYASHWVRARIGEYVRVKKDGFLGGMGTGKVRYQAFYKFESRRAKLESEGVPRDEIMATLATEFGTTEERLATSVQRHAVSVVSLEDVRREGEIPLSEKLCGNDANAEEQLVAFESSTKLKAQVSKSLRKLDVREREIVRTRIMSEEKATLDALGSVFQVSRERARQLEARALDKLRGLLAEHAA